MKLHSHAPPYEVDETEQSCIFSQSLAAKIRYTAAIAKGVH